MSNPFKKIKRAVKKGAKKLKKGLGSLANQVSDKLVPKELAPFLPLLAFVPVPSVCRVVPYYCRQSYISRVPPFLNH